MEPALQQKVQLKFGLHIPPVRHPSNQWIHFLLDMSRTDTQKSRWDHIFDICGSITSLDVGLVFAIHPWESPPPRPMSWMGRRRPPPPGHKKADTLQGKFSP